MADTRLLRWSTPSGYRLAEVTVTDRREDATPSSELEADPERVTIRLREADAVALTHGRVTDGTRAAVSDAIRAWDRARAAR